jgi:hypothetical protein
MSAQTTERIRGQVVKVRSVDNHAIIISGKLLRIARVRDEPWDCLTAPEEFLERLRRDRVRADVFTFMQELADSTPRYGYRMEWDSHAVVPVSTYDHWWKKQLDNKSRNMIRRAQKNGVELRLVDFDDRLIAGIVEIYNESPVRQGKPFWHYGKDFETIKRDHATFLERSQFIGAFLGAELIGFAKLVHSRNVVSLMQIISKLAQRDKAPTNALIAKAVEVCAEAGIPHLHYGVWSKGGLGAFKTSHAFVRYEVPRYYIPLNARGRLALRANLHHKWTEALPESWIERLSVARQKWNLFRYRAKG